MQYWPRIVEGLFSSHKDLTSTDRAGLTYTEGLYGGYLASYSSPGSSGRTIVVHGMPIEEIRNLVFNAIPSEMNTIQKAAALYFISLGRWILGFNRQQQADALLRWRGAETGIMDGLSRNLYTNNIQRQTYYFGHLLEHLPQGPCLSFPVYGDVDIEDPRDTYLYPNFLMDAGHTSRRVLTMEDLEDRAAGAGNDPSTAPGIGTTIGGGTGVPIAGYQIPIRSLGSNIRTNMCSDVGKAIEHIDLAMFVYRAYPELARDTGVTWEQLVDFSSQCRRMTSYRPCQPDDLPPEAWTKDIPPCLQLDPLPPGLENPLAHLAALTPADPATVTARYDSTPPTLGGEVECLIPASEALYSYKGSYHNTSALSFTRGSDFYHLNGWRCEEDGSICPRRKDSDDAGTELRGAEFVSPVLRGPEGLLAFSRALKCLRENGACVNDTCGGHIHVGVPWQVTKSSVRRLLATFANVENGLFAVTGAFNRWDTGSYARKIKENGNLYQSTVSTAGATATTRIRGAEKYQALNISRLVDYLDSGDDSEQESGDEENSGVNAGRRGLTAEFRFPPGSLNFTKWAMLMQLCAGVVQISGEIRYIPEWDADPSSLSLKGDKRLAVIPSIPVSLTGKTSDIHSRLLSNIFFGRSDRVGFSNTLYFTRMAWRLLHILGWLPLAGRTDVPNQRAYGLLAPTTGLPSLTEMIDLALKQAIKFDHRLWKATMEKSSDTLDEAF